MVLYTSVKCVAMLCAITATSAYSVTSSKRVVALSSGELDATKCVAVLGQTAADDGWCLQNCGNTPPNCPPELCSCDGTGVAALVDDHGNALNSGKPTPDRDGSEVPDYGGARARSDLWKVLATSKNQTMQGQWRQSCDALRGGSDDSKRPAQHDEL